MKFGYSFVKQNQTLSVHW